MAYCQWDNGSHDDSANTGVDGAVNSRGDCEGQGGKWSYDDGLGDDGSKLPTGPPDLTLTAFYHPQGKANTQSTGIGGVFDCAAQFGSAHSIASLTGLGKLGGVTGFVANTLGGNTFSGLTTLTRTLTSSSATGSQIATQMGKAYLRGPLQGIPARPLVAAGIIAEDSAAKISPSGAARNALVKAAFNAGTGSDESLITLSGEVGLSTVETTAAQFATGVGEAKALFDLGTFLWGIGTCSVP